MILNGNGKLAKREITALEDSYLSFEGALAGQLLQNVDEVLQTRGGGQGLKLYSRLYNDPHIQAALNRLAGSVTCKDWIVAPGGEKRIDQKAADLVRSQLANLNAFDLSLKEENHSSVNGFDQLTRAMIVSGRLNGYVCAEVMWSNRDGQTVASEIRVRDPRQFGFMRGEQGYVLRHLTRENSWTGETPPLKKILVWSYGALDGSPYGRALGEAIFWPHFFKRNIIKFNLKFLENYASPKVVGKYPRGSQTDQLATLNAAVNTIANETGISIPETMMLEYLQANASGTVDAYEKAIRYFDEQISEVILGETGSLSQSTGGGSRARDEVGAESGAMVAKAIADSLSSTFNRLARWITDFNLPGAMPPTVYRDFEQGEEITSRSGVDKVLFDLGYRLTPERVADVYGSGYEQAGGDDKEPALISSLGVGGVQALTGLLTQAATGQLPKENAIAVLVSVFGIAEEAAERMVPDAPEKTPQGNPLDQLFGGQDGDGAGQQPPENIQFAEAIEAALSGTLDFAAKAAGGKKPNCNPAKSHFCQTANGRGSCVPLSKKCKFKPTGSVKAAADYIGNKTQASATLSYPATQKTNEFEDLNISEVKNTKKLIKKKIIYSAKEAYSEITPVKLSDGQTKNVYWSVFNTSKAEAFAAEKLISSLEERKFNKAAIDILENQWNGKMLDVVWAVKEGYWASNLPDSDKMAIAKAAKKSWPKILEKIPDNTILFNNPTGQNTKGNQSRAKIYEKNGFSKVDTEGFQYGIIKTIDGKKVIEPIQFFEGDPDF